MASREYYRKRVCVRVETVYCSSNSAGVSTGPGCGDDAKFSSIGMFMAGSFARATASWYVRVFCM